MQAQSIAPAQMTAAQLKKVAKSYGVTLEGDARRKGVKQQWIAVVSSLVALNDGERSILKVVLKTGNFNPEAAIAITLILWEVAHMTERNPQQQQLATWFAQVAIAA